MDKHFTVDNDGIAVSVDERLCGEFPPPIIFIGSNNG